MSEALKQKVINDIITVEGGYSNDAADSGGETMYGITAAEARANGYHGDMRHMPRSFAESVYAAKYWDALRLDEVAALSEPLAAELADTGVNCGVGTAATFLQRAVNVLNQGGKLYADLLVDGGVGPATIAALTAYLHARRNDGGETVLLRALNSLQGARYIELAERREKDEAFVFGWLKNRVS